MSRFSKNVETDAAHLIFGPELTPSSTTHCLILSEVAILLEACQAQRQTEEMSSLHLPPPTPVFLKSHQYVTTFGKIRNREVIRELRQALLTHNHPQNNNYNNSSRSSNDSTVNVLHEFEAIQLANLGPKTTEEARTLIPSLTPARIEDYELQRVIDEVNSTIETSQLPY